MFQAQPKLYIDVFFFQRSFYNSANKLGTQLIHLSTVEYLSKVMVMVADMLLTGN